MDSIHLIGFGSQGKAWAEILKLSGWKVLVYLSSTRSPSYEKACLLGFDVHTITELQAAIHADPSSITMVAFLTPDDRIGSLYRDFLANLDHPLAIILAHGFSVYSGDLKAQNPKHSLALLAPKAIGPQLLAEACQAHHAQHPHDLVAGFFAETKCKRNLENLAFSLGFSPQNLVATTFDQETIGDLISEQSLLCGSLFTLLDWTAQAMSDAKIPDRLIREECLSELELIVGLIRKNGVASTFKNISQTAQCGTLAMKQRLNDSNFREHFDAQIKEVLSRKFAERFRSLAWKDEAKTFLSRLSKWDKL